MAMAFVPVRWTVMDEAARLIVDDPAPVVSAPVASRVSLWLALLILIAPESVRVVAAGAATPGALWADWARMRLLSPLTAISPAQVFVPLRLWSVPPFRTNLWLTGMFRVPPRVAVCRLSCRLH